MRHLRRTDPVMAEIIRRVGPYKLRRQRGQFAALARSILSQQISTAAARTIRTRLEEKLGGPPSVARLGQVSDRDLKLCGVSGQKTSYLRDLANKAKAGELQFRRFSRMPDQGIIEQLTQVKGVGVWTAQMFLMFSLGREDVFPPADLGIRTAIRRNYGFREPPSAEQMQEIAACWSPHRTAASWYLWRSLDLPEEKVSKPEN